MAVVTYGPCLGCGRTSLLAVDDLYCSFSCRAKYLSLEGKGAAIIVLTLSLFLLVIVVIVLLRLRLSHPDLPLFIENQ